MEDIPIEPMSTDTISNDPSQVGSHFIQLRDRNKKGQTRFRCKTCGHEFTCSGKKRLIQHIIGKEYLIGKQRNISPCENPYLPLKEALLQKHRRDPIKTHEATPQQDSRTIDLVAHTYSEDTEFSKLINEFLSNDEPKNKKLKTESEDSIMFAFSPINHMKFP